MLLPDLVLEADPDGQHFQSFSWHFSARDRVDHDAGRTGYIPMNFGEAPDYYRRFVDPIDVVCLKTAPMDEHGYFNFGGAVTFMDNATLAGNLNVTAAAITHNPGTALVVAGSATFKGGKYKENMDALRAAAAKG